MRPEEAAQRQLHLEASGLDPSARPPAGPGPSLSPFSPAPAHGETSSVADRKQQRKKRHEHTKDNREDHEDIL